LLASQADRRPIPGVKAWNLEPVRACSCAVNGCGQGESGIFLALSY